MVHEIGSERRSAWVSVIDESDLESIMLSVLGIFKESHKKS